MTYYELLPYVFKRFCILRAMRTGLPTAWHYVKRSPLPTSDKPALFTMNIMPPMMTVWHHLVKKNLGDRVDTVIFDCSGTLNPKDFERARVQKFLNFYAATKSNEFLYHIAKNRKISWICDDDMFILDSKAVDRVEEELNKENTATLSFRPRSWWHFEIDGKQYEPSSSYCIAMNREIMTKEKLSLGPCDGNNHVSQIGKPLSRYDTFDKANETLIKKGYDCAIIPEQERDTFVTGFSGVSSSVMLLWYFKRKEQMLDYLLRPDDIAWRGNTLFAILSGLLAVTSMQEMHEKITGKPYLLPSMPERSVLEKIRREKEVLIRDDHSFKRVDEVTARLWNEI